MSYSYSAIAAAMACDERAAISVSVYGHMTADWSGPAPTHEGQQVTINFSSTPPVAPA